MEAVREIIARAVPLDRSDVDTDQIIPSDWLKRVERTGFGAGLFSEWRERSDFVLNQSRYEGAHILVAGPNFGTGSSREHAPVGAPGLRLPGDHLAPLRRHLPQQLPEDRPGAGDVAPGRRDADHARDRGRRNARDRRRRGGPARRGSRDRDRRAVRARRPHAPPPAQRPRRHRPHRAASATRSRATRARRPSFLPTAPA